MPYGGLPAWNRLIGSAPNATSPAPTIPQLLTSFGDFQNIYGGFGNLALSTSAAMNTQLHAGARRAGLLHQRRLAALRGNSACLPTRPPPSRLRPTTIRASPLPARHRPPTWLSRQDFPAFLNAAGNGNAHHRNQGAELRQSSSGSLLGTPGSGGAAPTLYSNGTGSSSSQAMPPRP